jgi:uncharacterized protein (UPF0276 family)
MLSNPIFPGFGLGLRPPHYRDVLEQDVDVDLFEVISENFMVAGGRPLAVLDSVCERFPVALHGVSLSLGAIDGVDRRYLGRLRTLVDRVDPLWVSDHLCWTGLGAFNSHDLLPLPYTAEAFAVVADNLRVAQDLLGRRLLVENPSSYVTFANDEMPEWTFLGELCGATGCELLVDVNNVYVSATNHGFDPLTYLRALPPGSVRQFHLAGHSRGTELLIDTHDAPVPPAVWDLYREARRLFPAAATIIERDDAIPPLGELLAELDVARAVLTSAAA